MSSSPLTASSTNSIGMPLVGFGTYQLSFEQARAGTETALKIGYRHIDTAEVYRNEKGVGEAIKASGIPRNEIFVTTKCWPGNNAWNQPEKTYDDTIEAFKASLKRLGLDYVDLYLLHHALAGTRLQQWKALVELQRQGLAKHIGVSNYGVHHLQELEAAGLPTPAVNQIEIHPLCCQTKLLAYMKQKGILPIAYSSLAVLSTWRSEEGQGGDATAKIKEEAQKKVQVMAEKYQVPASSILLRWALQHGFCILPKSSKPERIAQNFELFGFEIAEADMKVLDDIDRNQQLAWVSFVGTDFNVVDAINPLVEG